MAGINTLTFTKDSFDSEVLGSSQPVLVDFWATWCGPCRMVAPIIDQVADEFAGVAKVGKVDIDAEPELAQRYQVMSIPTLVVFKDGQEVSRAVGVRSKDAIASMINAALK